MVPIDTFNRCPFYHFILIGGTAGFRWSWIMLTMLANYVVLLICFCHVNFPIPDSEMLRSELSFPYNSRRNKRKYVSAIQTSDSKWWLTAVYNLVTNVTSQIEPPPLSLTLMIYFFNFLYFPIYCWTKYSKEDELWFHNFVFFPYKKFDF